LQTFDSWERLVIVHELTHVFHLDRSRGLWKTLQTLFGRVPGLFPNEYQPEAGDRRARDVTTNPLHRGRPS